MKTRSIITLVGVAISLRIASADEVKPGEQLHVVGVGAHPDDVAGGAGGVIASYVKRGHRATISNVTLGETVRPPRPEQES